MLRPLTHLVDHYQTPLEMGQNRDYLDKTTCLGFWFAACFNTQPNNYISNDRIHNSLRLNKSKSIVNYRYNIRRIYLL